MSLPAQPPTLRPVASHPAAEDAWVSRARAGEMAAWGQLYQAYFPALHRHVRFLAGHAFNAEDLVQETFARALVKLPGFDGRSRFSTWLHGIAINVVRNHWRAQRNTSTAHARLRAMNSARDLERTQPLDHTQLCRARAEIVYTILEAMPEHFREAFVLRDLEGLAPAEAASALGISPGNLAVRASRARERIRRELDRLGWLHPNPEDPR